MRKIRDIKNKIKYAYQRLKYGCDERSSWDIEYAMIEYLIKALNYYLDKAPEIIADEEIDYKNGKESKYVLACMFNNKLNEYAKNFYVYDEKEHEKLRKELKNMWEALRDYLSW